MKQIQKTRASTVTQTVSYSYDGAGQRVKVTDSGGTRYFLYDGGMPLLEFNATKNIIASYLYGADGVVYRKKHTSTPSYEYHLKNALGSTIIATNNSKTVLARYEYDVFGAVRSETGSSDNVRKFTGKEYDADVKLYYSKHRYYDPYIGRFTSRDPIGDGINWYAYVANNPLKYIDPTGLRPANPDERADIIYTFGHTVGTILADIIDIEVVTTLPGKVHGRVVSNTKILLNAKHYKPNDSHSWTALAARATLIHEVAHIWQRKTGLHQGGTGGQDYDYTFKQLATLNLKKEEHAKAVQNWFFVTYGLSTGMIGASDAWMDLANHNLNINYGDRAPPPAWIWNMVASTYAPVIDEIRNPNNLPNRRGWRRAVINYFTWFR